ncbi:MAG TPA: hypothetical protein VLV87_04670 [Gammaproteobacteria bacterium]|nr:hypothetical protein [Gammaproteobacteria bacterium]
MRILMLVFSLSLLAACAHAPTTGFGVAMHSENGQQVGWQQVTTGDGNPLFVVRSNGKASYADLLKVAEAQAEKFCPYGYSVVDLEGNDQPQVDSLSPKFVLASEVRFKVRCYEKDSGSN